MEQEFKIVGIKNQDSELLHTEREIENYKGDPMKRFVKKFISGPLNYVFYSEEAEYLRTGVKRLLNGFADLEQEVKKRINQMECCSNSNRDY